MTSKLCLRRLCRAACCNAWAAVIASCLLSPELLHAQDAGAEGYQVYPLRHMQAAEVEPQLAKLLAGLPQASEVVADPRSNRLFVRGPMAAHQMVRQFLGNMDKPADPPSLEAYAVPAAQLNAATEQLQKEFGGLPQVKFVPDPRTSQILVVAPRDVHARVAQRLGANPPAAAQPANAAPAGLPTPTPPANAAPVEPTVPVVRRIIEQQKQTIQLQHSTYDQMRAALSELCGNRFTAAGRPNGDIVPMQMLFADQQRVQVVGNRATNQIELQGRSDYLEPCVKLIQVLDSPQPTDGSAMRVLPVRGGNPANVRSAVRRLQGDGPAASFASQRTSSNQPAVETPQVPPVASNTTSGPQLRGAIPLVSRLFQQPAPQLAQNQPPANEQPAPANQPAAQPGLPNQPLPQAAQPDAQQDVIGSFRGFIGEVRIEYIPELDIILIFADNAQDAETAARIIEEIDRLNDLMQPIIEVHMLQHTGSEQMSTVITQLYTAELAARQGRVSITPLVKPNALLLIGRKESIESLKTLIAQLDQPVEPSAEFAVFPLRHAAAAAVQQTITQFYGGTGTGAGAAAQRPGLSPRVLATADYRSNSLIIHASPRDMAEVAELIRKLDVSESGSVNELRVFPLKNSLAAELAPILQEAISGQSTGARTNLQQGQGGFQQLQGGQGGAAAQQSQQRSTSIEFQTLDPRTGRRRLQSGIVTDVRITADPRANALMVSAPKDSMELIEALILQLDQIPAAEAQIKVFTIVNGDAASMVDMLEALFGQSQGGAGQRGGGGGGFFQQGGGTQGIQGENPLVQLRFSVDERTNSIIASGAAGDLNVVEAILLRLDESDVRSRQTVVYRLKNSPAADVANAVNNFLTSERSLIQQTPGQISLFQQIEREAVVVPEIVSNSLIVSATPRYFEEIRRLVEQLDARPPMVMVQVLIAEVTLNNTDEFGVELGIQDSILFDRGLVGDLVTTTNSSQQAVPGGGTITSTNEIIQSSTRTPGFNFNNQPLGNNAGGVGDAEKLAGQAISNFAVNRVNSNLGFGGLVLSASSESLSILIRALKECRRLDVLSRPQIMTLDNQPAFIQVGSRVPRVTGVQTNEVGQTNNVQDEPVGLILGVTPRISPDGLVVMLIDAEKSALGPEAEGVPISISANGSVVRQPVINTTTASTTVSAVDGQTVVLGGLITKAKSATRRRVPLLASIPILGHLFRYDSELVQRTELLIILTPHIVRNEADAEEIKQVEAARMNWCLADVQKVHGDSGLHLRGEEWGDDQTRVVYPHQNPTGAELMPTPSGNLPDNSSPSMLPPVKPQYVPTVPYSPSDANRGPQLPGNSQAPLPLPPPPSDGNPLLQLPAQGAMQHPGDPISIMQRPQQGPPLQRDPRLASWQQPVPSGPQGGGPGPTMHQANLPPNTPNNAGRDPRIQTGATVPGEDPRYARQPPTTVRR